MHQAWKSPTSSIGIITNDNISISNQYRTQIHDKLNQLEVDINDIVNNIVNSTIIETIKQYVNETINSKIHNTIIDIKSIIDDIFNFINKLIQDNQDLKKELADTKKELAELKIKYATLEEEHNKLKIEFNNQRQQILIGQIAYIIDSVAVEYIGIKRKGTTINQIRYSFDNKELNNDQINKYNKFIIFVNKLGLELTDIIAISSSIRMNRYSFAHGTKNELNTPKKTIEEWINNIFIDQTEVQDIKDLLVITEHFTEPNKPLMKTNNVTSVIESIINN